MAKTKTQEVLISARLFNVASDGGAANASGHQTINFTPNITGGGATGLANDATTYTLKVSIDGAADTVCTVTGSDVQTFTALASELQTDLNAAVGGTTCAVVSGDLKITSGTVAKTTGLDSTISISDGTTGTGGGLLAALTAAGKTHAIATSVDGEHGVIDVLTINGRDVRKLTNTAEATAAKGAILQAIKDFLD